MRNEKTIKEMTVKERINLFLHVMKDDLNAPLVSVDFLDWLIKSGFFTAPASTKYHGDYEGGLFDHSFAVTDELVHFTDKLELQWKRPQSPFIVGMFHDLCKIDQYEYIECLGYQHKDCLLSGHGIKSIALLSQFMTLTEEEILCIRYHMGAYETEDWKGFDAAIRKYPTVLFTHTADMLASKLKT